MALSLQFKAVRLWLSAPRNRSRRCFPVHDMNGGGE